MPANSLARYDPRPPTPTTATLMRSLAPSTLPGDAALAGLAAKALAATPSVAPTPAAFFIKSLRLTDGWFSAMRVTFLFGRDIDAELNSTLLVGGREGKESKLHCYGRGH